MPRRRRGLDHLRAAAYALCRADQRPGSGARDHPGRMDRGSLLPAPPGTAGRGAAPRTTPALRVAGRLGIGVSAGLLAGTLLGLRAVPAAADDGWTIDSFDVVVTVNPDSTMAVSERLQVDFGTQQHHGIFRDIPVVYQWDQHSNRVYKLTVDSVTNGTGRAWSYSVSDV